MEGKICHWSARLHSPLFPLSGHRQVWQRDHPAGPPPARGVSDHRCKCVLSPPALTMGELEVRTAGGHCTRLAAFWTVSPLPAQDRPPGVLDPSSSGHPWKSLQFQGLFLSVLFCFVFLKNNLGVNFSQTKVQQRTTDQAEQPLEVRDPAWLLGWRVWVPLWSQLTGGHCA